jgi:hypothetical protein
MWRIFNYFQAKQHPAVIGCAARPEQLLQKHSEVQQKLMKKARTHAYCQCLP